MSEAYNPPATPATDTSASDSLDALFARIKLLEKRICGNDLEDRFISTEQLLEVLREVAAAFHATLCASDGPAGVRLDMSGAVQAVIADRLQREQRNVLMSIAHAAVIQSTEYMFRYLEYSAGLAADAYAVFQHLQVGIARLLLSNSRAMNGQQAPAWQFFDILIDICRRYDAHAGPRAERMMQRIGELIQGAVESPPPCEEAFSAAGLELADLLRDADRHSSQVAANLIAREQAGIKSDDAKQIINQSILEAVEGKRLPVLFLEFLQQVWNKHLFITYLREGVESRAWKNAVGDIHVLAHGIGIRNRDELFRYYSTHLNKSLTRVRDALQRMYTDDPITRGFLRLMDRLQQHVMEGAALPQLEEVTINRDTAATASSGESAHAQPPNIQVGSWYLLAEKDLHIRCKLIEINPTYHYCLFVNLSGLKVARHGFGDIASRIKDGRLKPLNGSSAVAGAVTSALRHMAIQVRAMERQAEFAERQRIESQEKKRREQALQREHQRREAALKETEAALKETQQQQQAMLEQQKQQVLEAARARAAQQQQAREQAMERTLRDIGRMQSGGWLDLVTDDGNTLRCKLGLKLKSSGKLIFVDNFGRKVKEFLPTELAERIIEGAAAVSDYGVAFDDTLGDLITDRSQKIKTDE